MPVIPNSKSAALLVVDMQPDFMPGGALPVAEGHLIIEPIRQVMLSSVFSVMAATQDWHPPGHISFASSHPGGRVFEEIDLYGRRQMLWPDHCVQETEAAGLHPALPWEKVQAIVRKGTDPAVDSYSAFRNNWDKHGKRPPSGLAGYLHERGVTEVFLCGLARDYCCKWSAEDAVASDFRVFVIWDCTRPVDPSSDPGVRSELVNLGVGILMRDDLCL